jgi:hypothetical protein
MAQKAQHEVNRDAQRGHRSTAPSAPDMAAPANGAGRGLQDLGDVKMKLFSSLLAAGLVVATGALAAELPPGAGASITLGDVAGVAYYTTEPDGYRVVMTLAAGEYTSPIRFIAVLQPGQKAVVSVPGRPGESDTEVEIVRVGDQVYIGDGPGDVHPAVQTP